MKVLVALLFVLFTATSFAQECASNVSSLRNLVGNADVPLKWRENSGKNTLELDLGQKSGLILLKITSPKGDWATIQGQICKTGQINYVAKINTIEWGPAAPGMAKMAGVKEIKIKFPYPNLMKVSVSFFGFEFSPLQ